MTRKQAIEMVDEAHRVAYRTGVFSNTTTSQIVAALEALGLIKFDAEPKPVTHPFRLCNNAGVPGGDCGSVLESEMIAALRAAGYEVRKSAGPKWEPDPVRNLRAHGVRVDADSCGNL